MNNTISDFVIGYYVEENTFQLISEEISLEEFFKIYPGKKPVLSSHLADDDDYVPDEVAKLEEER